MGRQARRAHARLLLAEQRLKSLEGEVARRGDKDPSRSEHASQRHGRGIAVLTLTLSLVSIIIAGVGAAIALRGVFLAEEQTLISHSAQRDGRAARLAELTRVLHDREPCEGDPAWCPHRATLTIRERAALELVMLDPDRLAWADLRNARLTKHFERPTASPVNLTHARLDFADMTEAKLVSADLSVARLERANLTDSDLRGAILEDAFLRGAFLGDAQLQRARMMSAWLDDAFAERADFSGADMFAVRGRRLQATGAHFDGARLLGSLLVGADMRAAHLVNAELRDASLMDADLRGADVTNADLAGADLRGANLEGVRGIVSVRCDGNTLWPDGLPLPPCAQAL